MNISDFPLKAGKLYRKSVDEVAGRYIATYTLDKKLQHSKKYGNLAQLEFKVRAMKENFFQVLIGTEMFAQVHSKGSIAIELDQAFNRESIRVGINEASPKQRSPPEPPPSRPLSTK